MANQGLIFIPDISGFSRFVNETEIEHSRMIIQELLEAVINSNQIGLEVSEVEGDAILFYRFGEAPDLAELYRQVETMFCSFHKAIRAYEIRKYCYCRACKATSELTLKVITHYGEFTGYTVSSFNKLIGKGIIVAHELLKNDIEQHEYWLVTHSLAPEARPAAAASWMEWSEGAKRTQSGDVPFRYAHLGPLLDTLAPEQLPQPGLERGTKVVSASREYDVDMITLLHACGEFSFRDRWLEGVVRVEELDHLLPRVGMRCRCVFEDGSTRTYTSTYYDIEGDTVQFVETEQPSGDVTRYFLERLGPDRARLTIEHYVMRGAVAELKFKLLRKASMERSIERSMENLVTLAHEIPKADVS